MDLIDLIVLVGWGLWVAIAVLLVWAAVASRREARKREAGGG